MHLFFLVLFLILYKNNSFIKIKMNKKDLPFFANKLNEMFPDAKTELYYTNEFQLLIAILMSAQATDKQVNIINRNFFNFLKSPSDAKKL
jgi:endonuclease-3